MSLVYVSIITYFVFEAFINIYNNDPLYGARAIKPDSIFEYFVRVLTLNQL